ncbi:RNA exonuclease 3 [Penicillium digitatum]|uniref:RNA exonuclease 3 n=3 Tax=Penicillium digitatum TaxID=36651 RepID=K9G2B5_PEND2|nr:RNA exonuclease 3 [Penicillium digitatum Pd1]EKV07475.1 RNA exonuclease 3 [Penicillium digitatum Pd1]EKV09018.1 RNA exonuclease 3 [Penicillium digitatum PHI26]QQK41234.1 RNA exonuclease 3 [Penicillium digitatum]
MFTPLGLFRAILCPQGNDCTLLKCIFSHDNKSNPPEARPSIITTSGDDGPPPKRAKKDNTLLPGSPIPSDGLKEPSVEMARHSSRSVALKQNQNPKDASRPQEIALPTSSNSPPNHSGNEPAKRTNTAAAGSSSQLPPRKVPKETLNPRMLAHAPATHGSRTAILQKLHSAMTALNEKLRKDKNSSNRCFVLTPDELITMALDEEEKFARDSPSVYGNVIKLRIVRVTKMGVDEWAKEVMSHLNARYYKINPVQKPPVTPRPINTGLTPAEEIAVVSQLVTPLAGLEEHGYVTKQPTNADIEAAKRGVSESKGWEKCDRCGQRFQVFPGRREDGTLASGGYCNYHPGRPVYPQRKKTDHVTGPSQPYFPCCSEALGTSTGCTRAETHVYKVSETKRLASILQFQKTPSQPGKGHLEPVSIDCEMGYTTLGLELIRLTAVSWPKGSDLLDVLVRPMGEVLDLNTRFSGVTPQHYASASPYGTPIPKTSLPSADEKTKTSPPLQLVQSPAEARELLLKLLQPETPLIGHAIDNDLNACRIIHPTVIDTVLLYPHPRGLPIRLSLKALVQRHLGRDIQVGDNGHDSKEDSVATGDLVRVKVGEKWKELQKKGQRIEGGKLVRQDGEVSTFTSSWTTVQKRKSCR